MSHITPSNFEKLSQEEEKLNQLLNPSKAKEDLQSPSKQSVNNILSYSRALSVRPSKEVDYIENILN